MRISDWSSDVCSSDLGEGAGAASFNALQQRLGRKQVSARMLAAFPAFVRLYDILFDGGEDLRGLRWDERRRRLDAIVARLDAGRFDLSPVLAAVAFAALHALRDGARAPAHPGITLNTRDPPCPSR